MLYYVNGVCGSGKTVTAIDKIAERVKRGETIIYATSTIRLLEQTNSGLKGKGVETELIASDYQSVTASQTVSIASKLLDSISSYGDCAKVILCVTKTLINIASKLPDDVKLPLFIDEGFQVVDTGFYNSTTPDEVQGVRYLLGLIKKKPKGYSVNKEYELPSLLERLSIYVKNPLYEAFSRGEANKLEWVVSLKVGDFLKCFSEVTMLSACFEDTLECYAAKAAGVELRVLDWGLDTEHYSNGKVTVCWVLSNNQWITSFVKKLDELCIEDIVAEYRDMSIDKFISVKNLYQDINYQFEFEDDDGSIIVQPEDKILPVYAHGFNDYTDYKRYLNLHTQMPLNYLQQHLMKEFKMTKEQIRESFYHYLCYQSALRIVLRKSSKKSPINIDTSFCFGDEATARYFVSKISSSVNIVFHQLERGKLIDVVTESSEKISLTDAEEENRRRDRKKLRTLGISGDESMDEALLILRDWRREHQDARISKKLLKLLVLK